MPGKATNRAQEAQTKAAGYQEGSQAAAQAPQSAGSCPDCQRAKAEVWSLFHAGCDGCRARMVARSPQFDESRRTGKLTPAYRSLLAVALVTHSEAKAAADADAMGRRGGKSGAGEPSAAEVMGRYPSGTNDAPEGRK